MKILVTGGAGYIGSTLVPLLLDEGYQVTVLDNFRYGVASLASVCYNEKLRIIRADIRDKSLMAREIPLHDAIIPLAALVGAPLCSAEPELAKQINRDAIYYMTDIMSSEQLLIMPTTNSAYGSGDDKNQCDEQSPLRPLSIYAKDKVDVESRILERAASVSLRLATVFGMSPRMRLDLLVNDFTFRAHRDRYIIIFEGSFKRNYIHVRDVARGFIHVLRDFSLFKGQVFNLGLSTANVSKLELCQEIAKQVPDFTIVESKIGKDPDQRNYIVSNAKFEATGFRPEMSLDYGISELLKGYTMFRSTEHRNF